MSAIKDTYTINLDLGRNRMISLFITPENRSRLSITVHPDLSVTVKAPAQKSHDEIVQQIKKRRQWIIKQLSYFEKFHPIQPERRYVSGETHFYLGRQYRLKVIEGARRKIKLKGKYFEVEIPETANNHIVKDILWEWYRTHAKIIFEERIAHYIDYFKRFHVNYPELHIRCMIKRWGSCPNGEKLLINTELIKASKYCIDYVIVHELCHLVYPRHGREFYSLLRRVLPDWEQRKEKLELSTR